MTDLSPREIVSELDRFIVGQNSAKRAMANALRNRWRRLRVDEKTRAEIIPKNILMIGPTGCGKTEIARRIARLTGSPFIKVEATKFTEVGYVGRDVEQIIRDLVEIALARIKEQRRAGVRDRAHRAAEERILDALVGPGSSPVTRDSFRKRLRAGEMDDKEVEIEVLSAAPALDFGNMPGVASAGVSLGDLFGKAFGRTKPRRTSVRQAYDILIGEESDKLIDDEQAVQEAIHDTENSGIVFVDEIDKVCAGEGRRGADVSREGVQRDLLPLIEGTTVNTKHGPVRTDHILFVASGAFHIARPSDLLPELQGRLPIRVELHPLSEDDFRRILVSTEASLVKQYVALLKTEGVDLVVEPDAVDELARVAVHLNSSVENIGARRLHTVLERVLDDIGFNAPDRSGETVRIDADYVRQHVTAAAQDTDMSRFIL